MTLRTFRPRPSAQRGTAAVEFAAVAMVFLVFMFGLLEMTRAFYLWSTMTEVVSRAARAVAMTDPSNPAALAEARRNAIFLRNPDGKLTLGGDIDESYLLVDYLARDMTTKVAAPPCPAQNVINCLNDPDSASCVRFVRVRMCQPGTECTPVPYPPLFSVIALDRLEFPTFATVVAVETLGARANGAAAAPAACP
jgi:hypothetical protein